VLEAYKSRGNFYDEQIAESIISKRKDNRFYQKKKWIRGMRKICFMKIYFISNEGVEGKNLEGKVASGLKLCILFVVIGCGRWKLIFHR